MRRSVTTELHRLQVYQCVAILTVKKGEVEGLLLNSLCREGNIPMFWEGGRAFDSAECCWLPCMDLFCSLPRSGPAVH